MLHIYDVDRRRRIDTLVMPSLVGLQSPGWSPDGEHLAFSMLVPEKPPMLVDAPSKPKDAEWAEEPRVTTRLYYERDGSGYIEPGYRHYFVVSALGGTPRQVTGKPIFFEICDTLWAVSIESLPPL